MTTTSSLGPTFAEEIQLNTPSLSVSRSAPCAGDVTVLHLINGEHYSGAERVQDLLAAALPLFGYQVQFAALKPGKFPQRRQYQGAPLISLPMASSVDLRILGPLVRFAKARQVQIVHAHTPRTALLAGFLARWTGLPWIYHVHSPTVADSQRIWQNRINSWIERWSFGNVERLITVSASLAEHMRGMGFGADQIHVVPNGVPAAAALATRPLPGPTWQLGTVALFRPRKGTEILLEAMALLRGRGKRVCLQAVGPFETADYEQTLRGTVQRLQLEDCVTWTGFCDNVAAEMQQMDLLVLPSLYGEGMPMVVLEAMAQGVPVVASRVEGTPEVIRDGEDGLLCQPQSAVELADTLERMIDQRNVDWHVLRSNAFARQRERYSAESMARGVADVYDEVLAVRQH